MCHEVRRGRVEIEGLDNENERERALPIPNDREKPCKQMTQIIRISIPPKTGQPNRASHENYHRGSFRLLKRIVGYMGKSVAEV